MGHFLKITTEIFKPRLGLLALTFDVTAMRLGWIDRHILVRTQDLPADRVGAEGSATLQALFTGLALKILEFKA